MSAFSPSDAPTRPGVYVNFVDVDPLPKLEPRFGRRVLTQVSKTALRRVEFSGGSLDGLRRFIHRDELGGAVHYQPCPPLEVSLSDEPPSMLAIPPVETYALEKWVDGLGGLFYEAKLA